MGPGAGTARAAAREPRQARRAARGSLRAGRGAGRPKVPHGHAVPGAAGARARDHVRQVRDHGAAAAREDRRAPGRRGGRRRDGTPVPAPRRGAGAGGVTVARRDGAVLVGFGPGAVPEDRITGSTWLSDRRRSAGRIEKCGRSVGVRGNHKLTILMGAGSRRTVVAEIGDDSSGDAAALLPCGGEAVRAGALRGRRGRRPRVLGAGAHGPRASLVGCGRMGVRIVSPIRVNGPGRGKGAPGWRGEASLRLGGVRDARGFRPGLVPIETRRLFREGWKLDVGYGIRSRAGAEFSAPRRLYGGDVMAVSPDNVIREIVGKLAIHNALLEAAGAA